jgi:hypothetical protein
MKRTLPLITAVIGIVIFEANANQWIPKEPGTFSLTQTLVAGVVGAVSASIGYGLATLFGKRDEGDSPPKE